MTDKVLCVIELFSGIGGFHLALKSFIASSKLFENSELKVYPFDNNCNANKVYQHNFNIDNVNNKNIEHLNCNDFDNIRPFIITMSPPCQPYSRAGIKKDSNDKRSNALHHFCDEILPKMRYLPNYIILENVIGFETSESCQTFLRSIINCSYQYQILSIDPTQIGIPNTRKRIYILAKLNKTDNDKQVKQLLPDDNKEISIEIISKLSMKNNDIKKLKIGDIITQNDDEEQKEYLVDMEKIDRCKGYKFSIVTRNDYNSECFTKAYATKKKFSKGTGSLFASKLIEKDDIIMFKDKYENLCKEKNDINHQKIMQLLSTVGLRYFTPKEMSLLMGFPSNFSFPDDMNDLRFYKLIGNSVNVKVVTILLSVLLES